MQGATHLAALSAPSAIAATALPVLYSDYRAAPPDEQVFVFLGLLLVKRMTLYASAAGTVYVAAKRSSSSEAGLGARLEQLTAEAMYPMEAPSSSGDADFAAVVETLDSTSDAAQAATLPLVFGALLVSAYAFNVLVGSPEAASELTQTSAGSEWLSTTVREYVQPLSTASVCFFALNAEAQAAVSAFTGTKSTATDVAPRQGPAAWATWGVALGAVAGAYLLPVGDVWPLQNTLNSCIAIGVARVLQIPSLLAVCAALTGLALYDGFGTLGAASAADPATAAAATSVMEGVAQAKLSAVTGSGQLWQPGLLTVLLQGRVTDALGLGDIVAPSILAGWAARFDARLGQRSGREGEEGRESSGGYLGASLAGYGVGCLLLEVVPAELSRAALLFLVPSMLSAVLGRLVLRNDLGHALSSAGEQEGLESPEE